MARGWESKSVEDQIEAAKPKEGGAPSKHRTPEQLSQQKELDDLQLSRIRIVHDLEAATHPGHRESLSAALKFLDDKIAKLC